MSAKSWIITILPMATGIGFTIFSFVTGHQVTGSEADLIDKMFYWFLGAGAIGATKTGYDKYTAYKNKSG